MAFNQGLSGFSNNTFSWNKNSNNSISDWNYSSGNGSIATTTLNTGIVNQFVPVFVLLSIPIATPNTIVTKENLAVCSGMNSHNNYSIVKLPHFQQIPISTQNINSTCGVNGFQQNIDYNNATNINCSYDTGKSNGLIVKKETNQLASGNNSSQRNSDNLNNVSSMISMIAQTSKTQTPKQIVPSNVDQFNTLSRINDQYINSTSLNLNQNNPNNDKNGSQSIDYNIMKQGYQHSNVNDINNMDNVNIHLNNNNNNYSTTQWRNCSNMGDHKNNENSENNGNNSRSDRRYNNMDQVFLASRKKRQCKDKIKRNRRGCKQHTQKKYDDIVANHSLQNILCHFCPATHRIVYNSTKFITHLKKEHKTRITVDQAILDKEKQEADNEMRKRKEKRDRNDNNDNSNKKQWKKRKIRRFKCDYCNTRFNALRDLLQHIMSRRGCKVNRVWQNEDFMTCIDCHKRFFEACIFGKHKKGPKCLQNQKANKKKLLKKKKKIR